MFLFSSKHSDTYLSAVSVLPNVISGTSLVPGLSYFYSSKFLEVRQHGARIAYLSGKQLADCPNEELSIIFASHFTFQETFMLMVAVQDAETMNSRICMFDLFSLHIYPIPFLFKSPISCLHVSKLVCFSQTENPEPQGAFSPHHILFVGLKTGELLVAKIIPTTCSQSPADFELLCELNLSSSLHLSRVHTFCTSFNTVLISCGFNSGHVELFTYSKTCSFNSGLRLIAKLDQPLFTKSVAPKTKDSKLADSTLTPFFKFHQENVKSSEILIAMGTTYSAPKLEIQKRYLLKFLLLKIDPLTGEFRFLAHKAIENSIENCSFYIKDNECVVSLVSFDNEHGILETTPVSYSTGNHSYEKLISDNNRVSFDPQDTKCNSKLLVSELCTEEIPVLLNFTTNDFSYLICSDFSLPDFFKDWFHLDPHRSPYTIQEIKRLQGLRSRLNGILFVDKLIKEAKIESFTYPPATMKQLSILIGKLSGSGPFLNERRSLLYYMSKDFNCNPEKEKDIRSTLYIPSEQLDRIDGFWALDHGLASESLMPFLSSVFTFEDCKEILYYFYTLKHFKSLWTYWCFTHASDNAIVFRALLNINFNLAHAFKQHSKIKDASEATYEFLEETSSDSPEKFAEYLNSISTKTHDISNLVVAKSGNLAIQEIAILWLLKVGRHGEATNLFEALSHKHTKRSLETSLTWIPHLLTSKYKVHNLLHEN